MKVSSSSSFELFVLNIMQENVHTLRVCSGSVCGSSVTLGHQSMKVEKHQFQQVINKCLLRSSAVNIIIANAWKKRIFEKKVFLLL